MKNLNAQEILKELENIKEELYNLGLKHEWISEQEDRLMDKMTLLEEEYFLKTGKWLD